MKAYERIRRERQKNNKSSRDIRSMPKMGMYAFFLVHMLMFGASGFAMAYFSDDVPLAFLYMHGGIAIFVYIVFYISIFGLDEVKWMFINAALGLFGIYAEVGWFLSLSGKEIGDFPWYVHLTPFLYYTLYTFLIRQLIIDLFRARKNEGRLSIVNTVYVILSLLIYCAIFIAGRS